MRAIDLVPVQHVLHADFWPEDFVVEKGESAQDRVGVVKRVIASARTCEVMWLPKEKEKEKNKVEKDEKEESEKKENNEKGEKEEKKIETEEVSMYAIESHPDFSYRLGSIVVRLNKEPATNTSTSEEPTTNTSSNAESTTANSTTDLAADEEMEEPEGDDTADDSETDNTKNEENTNENNENNNNNENNENNNNNNSQETTTITKNVGAWVGQIINIHNGIITVYWANGTISNARPEELFKINDDDYESDEESAYDSEYL